MNTAGIRLGVKIKIARYWIKKEIEKFTGLSKHLFGLTSGLKRLALNVLLQALRLFSF